MGNQKSLFIFGLGYSAVHIAQAAMESGFFVAGTSRNPERCNLLSAMGIHTYGFENFPSWQLEDATHILSSVPPQEEGDVVLPLLPETGGRWLGYLSTSGVYGDWNGQWVDEASEPRPHSPRLRRRAAAEQAWLAKGGHVFRLAGIYGAGRSAIEDVRNGTARRIDKPGQVFSRIHAEDIAQVILASMLNPNPGAIYNVCDDEPAPAHEVISYACALLGKPVPPLIALEEAGLSPMGMEFYSANRRVANGRIKRELGVALKYPTYREGLRAIAGLAQ